MGSHSPTMALLQFLSLLAIVSTVSSQFSSCSRPGCCDIHKFCKFWSMNNECNKNPSWMRKNCQMSCSSCEMASTTMTTTTVMNVTPNRNPFVARQPPQTTGLPIGCASVMPMEVETRQILSIEQVRAREGRLGCAEIQSGADCSVNSCFNAKYRSIDGSCNNLQQSSKGAAFTAFVRLLPSAYDDGFNAVVGAITRRRPNPRELSMLLISNANSIPSHANSLLMQFGQLISHDITKTAMTITCACNTGGPKCANVPVPRTEGRGRSCIPFTRSTPVCGTGMPGRPREQFNENTAFIDGSLVYSSEAVTLRSLRSGAMLRTSIINGRMFPPNNGKNSLSAGDDRATIFTGLAAMHTTFLRLHNNIAARLQNMNSHWNQDRVFQETKKLVGAMIQVVTYQEFLPTLIGPFHTRLVPEYKSYNPAVNPGVMNEFNSAAYRLHGMIQEDYPLLNSNFLQTGRLPFISGVNNFETILSAIDNLYRGFMATAARTPQRITTSVTEKLFGGEGDMATFNIQRGRDHGLRPYNDYRKLCSLQPLTSFDQWPEVTDANVRNRVRQLYNSPDDLDLYVGGILEEPITGSAVGPTFACIIAEQFVRLRDGDRFFYKNPAIFTQQQLASLQKVTLSWILCETGDNMARISPNAFVIDNGRNAVSCRSLPGLDLNPWRE